MKIVAIAGSIADISYNRQLLTFIASHYASQIDIELLEIKNIPMFNEDKDQTQSAAVQYLVHKIESADGVILATPEHNHTTSPAMKNVIEWLSYKVHPLNQKPVLIVGASWHTQGSSRAQLALRQIMESPGVGALVMLGNEFLLADAKKAFDELGNLKDSKTIAFLDTVINKFIRWINVLDALQEKKKQEPWRQEDLAGKHPVETSIDIDISDDWVEKAAKLVKATSGNHYVQLNRGVLTVDQLNWFLNSMPVELTFMDDNDQFIYYNHFLDHDAMLAPRDPKQVGNTADLVHPKRAVEHVQQVIWALRQGQKELIAMPVPGNKINQKYIMHFYKAMHDADGRYRGVNEWVLDIWPIVSDYLKRTGQKLIKDPDSKPDATTSASQSEPQRVLSSRVEGKDVQTINDMKTSTADAVTGASETTK